MSSFFFFNDTATTEIYTLSLHDALPHSSLAPFDIAKVSKPRSGNRQKTPDGVGPEIRRKAQRVEVDCCLKLSAFLTQPGRRLEAGGSGLAGEFAQPRFDCGVLLGTHLTEQHAHSEYSQAAAGMHVNHFAVQFASGYAIADAET